MLDRYASADRRTWVLQANLKPDWLGSCKPQNHPALLHSSRVSSMRELGHQQHFIASTRTICQQLDRVGDEQYVWPSSSQWPHMHTCISQPTAQAVSVLLKRMRTDSSRVVGVLECVALSTSKT